ncbi:DUF4129 domain-containing protein, partial [Rhodoferax sp. 4810]|nr:DUF4129 domain-containing protein [Rhodoferax jenense]
CMSLLWRFALTTSLAASLFIAPFPFWAAVLCLSMGALLSACTSNRNWRIIQVLLLHVVGLGGIIAIIMQSSFDGPGYLPDFDWLSDMLMSEKTPLQWFALFYLALSSIWLWLCGCFLIRKPRSHSNICRRFDVGTLCFFGLFLFRFLLAGEHGFIVNDSLSAALMLPFFLSSMIGLTLAGNSSPSHKEFIPGYKAVGIILSFTLMVLGIVAVSATVLQPVFKWSAETGYGVIKTVMAPLGPYFSRAILFIFASSKTYHASPAQKAKEVSSEIVLQQDSWLSDSTQQILSYLFVGMQALFLVVAILFLVWLLSRWLFSRTSAEDKQDDRKRPLLSFRTFILHIIILLTKAVKRIIPSQKPTADELYGFLLGWGQYSGVVQLIGETPCEYGRRLQNHFPELRDDIHLIVNAFTKQITVKPILHVQSWFFPKQHGEICAVPVIGR